MAERRIRQKLWWVSICYTFTNLITSISENSEGKKKICFQRRITSATSVWCRSLDSLIQLANTNLSIESLFSSLTTFHLHWTSCVVFHLSVSVHMRAHVCESLAYVHDTARVVSAQSPHPSLLSDLSQTGPLCSSETQLSLMCQL